jgi:hypothetical protein
MRGPYTGAPLKENRMKFKIFSMVVILGILSVMPMIYMGKFNPMAFFDSSISNGVSEFKNIKAKVPESLSSVVTDKKVQVYKWRDENGIMQFSNTPPPTGGDAEQIELNPNKNIVQAVKIPEKEETEEVAKTESPSPYSVKGMKKVMNDAKGVESLLDKRHEEQQKMMNDL